MIIPVSEVPYEFGAKSKSLMSEWAGPLASNVQKGSAVCSPKKYSSGSFAIWQVIALNSVLQALPDGGMANARNECSYLHAIS